MRQKTIALVDNDRASIEFMYDVLTDEGYQVVWCLSAAEVPILVRRVRPDLLILDIYMGSLEAGWDLIGLLRSVPATQHLPLIVCSTDWAFLRVNAQSLQARRCLVLEKPFRLEALLSLLHATIGGRISALV